MIVVNPTTAPSAVNAIATQTITNNADTIALPAGTTWTVGEIRLDTAANKTMSSTPTIPDGVDGQIINVMNVGAANTIALQSDPNPPGNLNGSNVSLILGTVTLGPLDSATLQFIGSVGRWIQIGSANVI